MSDWEAEKAFWAKHADVPRFDIEETSTGYDSYRDMVAAPESGDWVRAEDFRRVVMKTLELTPELKALLSAALAQSRAIDEAAHDWANSPQGEAFARANDD
jgi:hypothetical protein